MIYNNDIIIVTSSRGGGRSGVCVYRIGGSFPHHPTHHRSQIPIPQNPTPGCRTPDAGCHIPDAGSQRLILRPGWQAGIAILLPG